MEQANSSTEILLQNLKLANKVLTNVVNRRIEASNLLIQTEKERKEAKSLKTTRWIIPLISLLTIFVIPIIGLFIPIIVTIILWLPKNGPKPHLQKAEDCERKAQQKRNSVNILLQEYAYALDVVPQKYRHPFATSFLVEDIESGQATTLSDAIADLEEHIRREKVELYEQRKEETLKNEEARAKADAKKAAAKLGFDLVMDFWDFIDPNKTDSYYDYYDDI